MQINKIKKSDLKRLIFTLNNGQFERPYNFFVAMLANFETATQEMRSKLVNFTLIFLYLVYLYHKDFNIFVFMYLARIDGVSPHVYGKTVVCKCLATM